MAVLLLNLRDVPDDEVADIRALLDEYAIDFYETEPNRWGISAGAIWIKEDCAAPHANELMASYQTERRARVRTELAEARRDGTAESFWQQARKQPARLVLILFAIAIFVALSLWPLLLAARGVLA
ncbi:MAG: DUF6164 family protein [Dokdonella sp.]